MSGETSSEIKINLGSCDESFPLGPLGVASAMEKSAPTPTEIGPSNSQQPMMPDYAQSFQPHEYSRSNFLWV